MTDQSTHSQQSLGHEPPTEDKGYDSNKIAEAKAQCTMAPRRLLVAVRERIGREAAGYDEG